MLTSLLLTACLSELPIAAGPNRPPLGEGDADTDADADTDTDNPRDEICDDGEDNDLDGYADCEDSDCVDACVEICDDGEDNDQDGSIDCDDDECSGDSACGINWTMTAGTWTDKAYIAYGPDIEDWHGYPALLWMRGEVWVEAKSDQGDAFFCEGEFDVGPPAWDDAGAWWEDGNCEDCDYRFVMAPRVDEGTLSFRGDCPLSAIQPLRVGSHRGEETLTAIIDGDWQEQYLAEDAGWGWDSSDGHDFKWAGFWSMSQVNPRVWEVTVAAD